MTVKILYVAPAMADYQSDALFHGLRSMEGVEVTDAIRLDHMYAGSPAPEYGRGFTLYNLLPVADVSRDHIAERVALGEFDGVIYAGDFVYKPDAYPFESVVRRHIPPGRILIIDGSDSQTPIPLERRAWGTYYKRENVGVGIPISFAIPAEKLECGIWPRDRLVATYEPGQPYVYDAEQDYYDGYRTAAFARTRKKAGWDCLRHYEIMAAGCIPLFDAIDSMPDQTCLTLPRAALSRVVREWKTMDDETIAAVGRQMFDWCREYCTTETLARSVLAASSIVDGAPR